MAGTIAGGRKARDTNKKLHGADFYQRIGRKGGKLGTTGGFAARVDCDCAVFAWSHYISNCAGYKGGIKSKRGSRA